MNKLWSDCAWDDYLYWQTQDKKMVKDTERNGLQNGTGNPEPLKFRKAWSRRIDHADRLVYNIDENGNLWIIACIMKIKETPPTEIICSIGGVWRCKKRTHHLHKLLFVI